MGFIVTDIVVRTMFKNILREIAKREPNKTIAEFVIDMDSEEHHDYDNGDVI